MFDELRSADGIATAMWTVFVVIGLFDLYQYYRRGIFGVDFATVWAAAHALLHGHTKWGQFVYLPGCLILVLPLAAMPLRLARTFLYAAQFLGLGFTFWAITRITKRSLGSRAVAGAAIVLVVAGQVGVVSNYENFTLLLVPLAAAFYLFIDRGHSTAAAVALGISLTIKPLLAPLLLVFVIHRLWRSMTLAILIPVVLTCMAFVLIAFSGSPTHLIHEVFATFGSDNTASVNMSISGVATILSIPGWLAVIARLATLLLCVEVCRRMWSLPFGGPGEQAIWLTAPLLVGMVVCFTFAWAYYAVLFLPLALVALDIKSWGGRLVETGVVLALLFPLLPELTHGYPNLHTSDVIALLGLLVVLVGTGLVAVTAGTDAGTRPIHHWRTSIRSSH